MSNLYFVFCLTKASVIISFYIANSVYFSSLAVYLLDMVFFNSCYLCNYWVRSEIDKDFITYYVLFLISICFLVSLEIFTYLLFYPFKKIGWSETHLFWLLTFECIYLVFKKIFLVYFVNTVLWHKLQKHCYQNLSTYRIYHHISCLKDYVI